MNKSFTFIEILVSVIILSLLIFSFSSLYQGFIKETIKKEKTAQDILNLSHQLFDKTHLKNKKIKSVKNIAIYQKTIQLKEFRYKNISFYKVDVK